MSLFSKTNKSQGKGQHASCPLGAVTSPAIDDHTFSLGSNVEWRHQSPITHMTCANVLRRYKRVHLLDGETEARLVEANSIRPLQLLGSDFQGHPGTLHFKQRVGSVCGWVTKKDKTWSTDKATRWPRSVATVASIWSQLLVTTALKVGDNRGC